MINIIENLVDAINNIIDKKEGILIVHRAMIPNKTCKLFKKFSYKFYLNNSSDITNKLLFEFVDTLKVNEDNLYAEWLKEDFKCYTEVMKYLILSDFRKYLKNV